MGSPFAPVYQPDTVYNAIVLAKARLNDSVRTLQPVGGKILENTQDFSQAMVNGAWWGLQDYLADAGDNQFKDECIVSQIPAIPNTQQDPASRAWLSWEGYFDTQNLYKQPALPQFVTHPLKIWERWSNQNMQFTDPMTNIMDGIPDQAKWTANVFWAWKKNRIVLPGSQMVEDLRILYVVYMPDFLDVGGTPWFQQPIPLNRGRDALAWWIAFAFVSARDDEGDPVKAQAGWFLKQAQRAADRIVNMDVAMKQRVTVTRRPHNGRRNRLMNWQ